jgi:outer membrane protein assembly factor BamB
MILQDSQDRITKMKSLVLLVLFLSSTTINAQNWPSFRGPNASGVAEGTNPPITWDLEKSQNVLWKTNIPGLSHSSPIVWGNNVFVITAISSDAKSTFKAKDRGIDLATDDVRHTWMIFALDKRNGRVIWSEEAYEGVPRAKRHVKATQANSTPVTDGRYVVALFGSEGDLVIVQADGHKQSFIAAFNLKDGKQAWRVERDEITSWTNAIGERKTTQN